MSTREPSVGSYAFPTPGESLPFVGERYVPSVGDQIQHEHFHRYLFALQFCVGKDVLDLASGEGYGAALLGSVAQTVIGIDSSAEAVAHAERHYAAGNVRFARADACATPLSEATVDAVVSFETIEHLADHDGFFREIRRVLRRDGLLLLSTPDRDTYLTGQEPNPFHVRELSHAELAELLSSRFRHVAIGGQEAGSSSVIVTTHGTSVGANYFSRLDASEFEASTGPTRPTYLIALASDEELPAVAPSALMDVHHLPALHESHRQEVTQLWEELGARNDDVVSLRAELNARHKDVEQLSADLSTRNAELEQVLSERKTRELEVAQVVAEAEAAKAELLAIRSTLSWRLTSVLRAVRRRLP